MAANRVYSGPNAVNYGQQQLPRGQIPNGMRYTYPPPGNSPSVYSTPATPPVYNTNQMRPAPYYPQYIPPTNRMPSAGLQGTFSTYPARLRQSDNNALLLPVSYTGIRKAKFTGQSDDEFEEFDDDENGTPFSGTRTRSQAHQQQAGSQAMAPSGSGGTPTTTELRKIPRKRNYLHTNEEELANGSDIEEVLVPIRLDLDLDDIKLRDVFLWNMNEQFLTPEKFGEILCEDLELPSFKFIPLIAESIRAQVMDFESIHEVEIPDDGMRVVINLDLQIGKVNLRDRFEWDLANDSSAAPEVFSRQLASELGIGGEFVAIIAHAIREQLYRHKKQLVDEYGFEGEIMDSLPTGFRNMDDAEAWAPQMDELSNEELEKILIAQERSIRRMRRETRFKRSRRRMSPTPQRMSRYNSMTGTPI
ncbi:hypothetical protein INT44_005809 [Umbelopsis vinacea]|uniref:SNF5-domain-containing protein n=1 Tax=Umbelopsis vinacea TaxID=44442 RepID=A0A8H7UK79_9FUNG|nr:hypothetical protein INT44_005809 [Umbelopsis vinacea]